MMTKRYQKNISHYQWRPSFIKGREAEFETMMCNRFYFEFAKKFKKVA